MEVPEGRLVSYHPLSRSGRGQRCRVIVIITIGQGLPMDQGCLPSKLVGVGGCQEHSWADVQHCWSPLSLGCCVPAKPVCLHVSSVQTALDYLDPSRPAQLKARQGIWRAYVCACVRVCVWGGGGLERLEVEGGWWVWVWGGRQVAAAGAAPALPLCLCYIWTPACPSSLWQVLGYDLVVWRDGSGTWRAFRDACPHRAAPLSGGQGRQGRDRCEALLWKWEKVEGRVFSLQSGANLPCQRAYSCQAALPDTRPSPRDGFTQRGASTLPPRT